MTTAAPNPGETIRVVSLVSVVHMMSHVYHQALHPLFPTLTVELGVSYTALGFVMTAFSLATAIGQTPIGFLVDRIGGKAVLVAGLALQAVAVGAIGLTGSYWSMLALFTLAGLAHSVYHPADYSILSRTVDPSKLARAFTLHSSAGNLGTMLGPLMVVGLAGLWGWKVACMALGGVGILMVAAVWTRGDLLSKPRDAGTPGHRGALEDWREGLSMLLSRRMLMCFAFFVVLTMAFSGVRVYIVAAMHEIYGASVVEGTLVLTAFTAGTIGGMLIGGLIADRYGPRVFIAVIGLVGASALLVLVGAGVLPMVLAGGALCGAGFMRGFVQGVRDLMVYRATPDGAHGKAFGFVSTGSHVGHALMPLVFGTVMDMGRPSWVFWIGAVLALAALATFATVRRKVLG
jgi:predicted MFS family arabinose efflux permease